METVTQISKRTDLTHKHGHEIYHIFYQVQQVFLYFPPPI
jgi:hypothetical protein